MYNICNKYPHIITIKTQKRQNLTVCLAALALNGYGQKLPFCPFSLCSLAHCVTCCTKNRRKRYGTKITQKQSAYHFLFDKEGKEYKGKFSPEDNLNCKDGRYAAHVRNGNTGRIGLAICCKKDDNHPPTRKQIEAMCRKAAQLCTFYGINPSMCITHAEFDPIRKIDITEIPYKNLFGIQKCADYLRELTTGYYNKENEVK